MKINMTAKFLLLLFFAGAALLFIGYGNAASGFPGGAVESDSDKGGEVLYLRSPEDRLAWLGRFLDLTRKQRAGILRKFRKVDASVRAAVRNGDAEVRMLLGDEQREQYDELQPNTEVAPESRRTPAARLNPVQRSTDRGTGEDQRGRRGSSGGQRGGRGSGGGSQGF